MWVARMQLCGYYFEKDLSPKFESADECLSYIKKDLQVLEFLLRQCQDFIDLRIDKILKFRFGFYIRPYNLIQKRYCDGFDF